MTLKHLITAHFPLLHVGRFAFAAAALSAVTWVHAQTLGTTLITTAGASVAGIAPAAGAAPSVGGLTPANSAASGATDAAMLNIGAADSVMQAGELSESSAGEASVLARDVRPKATMFQEFVRQSTGQNLPVFGKELFGQPGTFAPVNNIAPPADYVLGVGDEVQLQIWGSVEATTRLVVDRDGMVMIPKVGALSVVGLKVSRLEPVLRARIAKVFKNFDLSVAVSHLRSIQVYVVGQARRPGTYTLSSLSTLINALFASGGPSAQGSMRAIELRRHNKHVTTLDLYDFILKGDQSADVTLRAGDVIVIPPVGAQVAVAGAFDHAAIFELQGNTSVGGLLNMVGGVSTLTAPQLAQLERVDPTRTPSRLVKQIALDRPGLTTLLKDGDVLTLMPVGPAFANEVTLRGAVAAPARYPWREGMRINDLIPSVDALISMNYYRRKNGRLLQGVGAQQNADQVVDALETINWDYAVIERLNKKTLESELIPFSLRAAVLQRDAKQNLELHVGDVVTVFNDKDIRLPQERQTRLVTLEGEVAAPGVYMVLPGETLPQLLRRVGGLTEQAYLYGATFTRASVRAQQQRNLEALIVQLEAKMSVQSSELFSDVTNARGQAALAQAQMSHERQKQELSRLKSMTSNGRVSMELQADAAVGMGLSGLPSLPLEDGDRLVVPPRPSFVSAFGAFNSQNVVIYKPGRTVADVYRLAGLREDANVDQAFIVRADGTVVSALQKTASWLGSAFEQQPLMPGDAVVVPQAVTQQSTWSIFTRNAMDITQILSNLGLGLAALRSL